MGSKEVGGVRAAAGAEVGCHDSNIRVHHGQCAGFIGWVGAGGEGEGEGDQSRDMENGVDTLESVRKSEGKGMGSGFRKDLKGS